MGSVNNNLSFEMSESLKSISIAIKFEMGQLIIDLKNFKGQSSLMM